MYGGGGIIPDLVVSPDTLTAEERAFYQEIVSKYGQQFTTGRLAFAVDYLRRNPSLERGFAVTPQMLSEYYDALQKAGVKGDRAMFDAARGWVSDDIAYEISYSKWGQAGATQRANSIDPQVLTAASLLRQATTPQSLFKLAADYAATHTPAPLKVGAAH